MLEKANNIKRSNTNSKNEIVLLPSSVCSEERPLSPGEEVAPRSQWCMAGERAAGSSAELGVRAPSCGWDSAPSLSSGSVPWDTSACSAVAVSSEAGLERQEQPLAQAPDPLMALVGLSAPGGSPWAAARQEGLLSCLWIEPCRTWFMGNADTHCCLYCCWGKPSHHDPAA